MSKSDCSMRNASDRNDSDCGSEDDPGSQGESQEASDDDLDAPSDFDDFAVGSEVHARKDTYRVLDADALLQRQQDAVDSVVGVLEGVSADEAAQLLRKFDWDVSRVTEEWFMENAAMRAATGLVEEEPQPSCSTAECGVCFDSFPLAGMRSAGCRHLFCRDCWGGYVGAAISTGPGCLNLRCPHPDCKRKAWVPGALVKEVAKSEEVARYERFLRRSFVEDNTALCWCTGKACDNAVECLLSGRAADEALDVLCSCSTSFCFNCKEEAHRPVRCAVVRQWVTKNSSESENLTWIMANTRPCPKCQRPIEKNQGCMHMTCSQCHHEFCWLCFGLWSAHRGDAYSCNGYQADVKSGKVDEAAQRRDRAKKSLERYMHYFERWDAHSKAGDKARVDAAKASSQTLEKLSHVVATPVTQLQFIMDGWHQVIECRRILKWTYGYGYYEFMEDADKVPSPAEAAAASAAAVVASKAAGTTATAAVAADKAPANADQGGAGAKKNQLAFFEFVQGDAERSLDRLHELCEKEVMKVLLGTQGAMHFPDLRKGLTGMTVVVHGYFDKLVKALEHGFGNLDADFAAPAGAATTSG